MKEDVVVVSADGGISQVMRGLLVRHHALQIRRIAEPAMPATHLLDSHTYAAGHEIANRYTGTHEHALVVLDYDGSGARTAESIIEDVERKLQPTWQDRGRCIVIVPELEAWLWSKSPHVATALGWPSMSELEAWLETQGYWPAGLPKPPDPKQAYKAAVRKSGVPPSNAIFREVAENVSLRRCTDPAFVRLLRILRVWFPAS